jgi:ketosteroid isomerase-like protein
MSQKNVEIVRRMLIEFDRSRELTEAWARDFIWETGAGYPGAPTTEYHGREGFYTFLEDWLDPYEEWEQELDDVLDAGGNQVVAVLHQRARLIGTEQWVDMHYGALYTLERGLIYRARIYPSVEEALEAAGLRE